MNVFGIGPMELILVLVLALIFIGPAKLPEVAGQLGRAINEFRRASAELSEAFSAQLAEEVAARKAAEQGASAESTADGTASVNADAEWAQQFATLEPNGYASEAEFGATTSVANADTAALPGTVLDSEAAYPPATNAALSPADTTDASIVTTGDAVDSVQPHPVSDDSAGQATASETPGIDPTLAMASPAESSNGNMESSKDESTVAAEPREVKKPARSRRRPASATRDGEDGLAGEQAVAETESSVAMIAGDGTDAAAASAAEPIAAESSPRPRRNRKPRPAASVASEALADSPAETTESEV